MKHSSMSKHAQHHLLMLYDSFSRALSMRARHRSRCVMQLSCCQTWYRRVAIVLCQQGTSGWRYQRLTSTYGVSIGSESEGSQGKRRGGGKGDRSWGGCNVDLEVERRTEATSGVSQTAGAAEGMWRRMFESTWAAAAAATTSRDVSWAPRCCGSNQRRMRQREMAADPLPAEAAADPTAVASMPDRHVYRQ